MLWSADQQVAARDEALPGLRTALDEEQLCRRLNSALAAGGSGGPGVLSCRLEYVRYKPGTSVIVRGVASGVGGGEHGFHLTAFRPDQTAKRLKLLDQPAVGCPLGPGRLSLESDHAVVHFFPNDGAVRSLWRLGESAAREELLEWTFADQPALWKATPRLLAYKPDRRAAIRLDVAGAPSAVLKLYAQDRFPACRRNAKLSRDGATLRVPRRIGKSGGLCAMGLEWIEGESLAVELSRSNEREVDSIMRRVAGALVEVHAQVAAGPMEDETPSLPKRLLSLAEAAEHLNPELDGIATDTAREINRVIARCELNPPARIHGDFYAKQVIVQPDRIGILDFDESRFGAAAEDVGNFIGHATWESLEGRHDASDSAAAALVEGYRRLVPGALGDDQHVAAWSAAGLFKLLLRPFRDRQPEWPQGMHQIVSRTRSLLRQAVPA